MTTITFNSTENPDWLYNNYEEWKENICDDFNEKVVVIGNHTYSSIEEASWWNKAKELIADLDNYSWDIEDFKQYDSDYSNTQLEQVYEAYQKCRYSDDTEFIMEVAKIINPNLELEQYTARGYSQSEWVEIVYIKDSIKTSDFTSYFFGQLTVIHIKSETEDYYDALTNDEVFNLFNYSKNTEKELRELFNIDENEPIEIIKEK